MPLTRHLYEIDEVVSALQTCLRRNWPRAHYWTWELVQSSEEALAFSTIYQTWLEYGGSRFYTEMTQPKTALEWSRLVLHVRFACRTVFPALSLLNEAIAAQPPEIEIAIPAAPTPKPFLTAAAKELGNLKKITRIWKMLQIAVSTKKVRTSLWILQALHPILSSDTIWLAIAALSPAATWFRANATAHPESQILHQANALIAACVEPALLPEDAPAVEHYVRDWVKWTAVVGRRAARIHEIPTEALHRETTRGCIPSRYTNIEDVRDPAAELINGCTWWREQAAAMGIHTDEGAVVFPSDDVLEAFYEQYFPDDIPDEWSARDQQKSHGRGCAETAPPPPPILAIREEPVDEDMWDSLGIVKQMATLAVA
jgi:hypothetical protein